tara:strand:- start:241 stop:822 length:582 start_codon:yes stop_codon:yes gene_type:complete
MIKKIILSISIITVLIIFFFYFKSPDQKDINENVDIIPETSSPTSNMIENVEYLSMDPKGNEYIIKAQEGEIDINNSDIIFLKNVKAIINLNNSKKILISADFGKYNINNFDTIFSKNVLIDYLDKKIDCEYLDFSISRNTMIISNNVVYKDLENTLKTDVIEINIETKETTFYMYDKNKKINIINEQYYGNN